MMGPLTSMSALCACATLRLKRAYKFTGKERDSESGLDDFGARYYASTMGRFMKPDPNQTSGFEHMRDPQSWNGYSIARNNPLVYVDPDGLNYTVCDTNGKNCGRLGGWPSL
jgi:RHS repeat-associated protein